MEEIWKDIEGFEGYYQISNFGNVKALANGKRKKHDKILKVQKDSDGYSVIGLHCAEKGIYSKTHKVHRLVAKAFVQNPDNLPEVNHKDENKTNNYFENLEWCTTKYNLTYGHRLDCARGERNSRHKLTADDVIEIRKIYVKGDLKFGQSALAKKYGVAHPSIAAIVNRETWKHI